MNENVLALKVGSVTAGKKAKSYVQTIDIVSVIDRSAILETRLLGKPVQIVWFTASFGTLADSHNQDRIEVDSAIVSNL
jgi:hypothetical protein